MVDAYFVKDLALLNTIRSFKNKDNVNVSADFYNAPATIVVWDWDNISALNQGLITTDFTTAGYSLDHTS